MALAPIFLESSADQTERLVEHLRETLKTLGGTSPARADRAVVGAAGGMIKLTLYAHEIAVATATLDPTSAIAFAGQLVTRLAPWLARGPREVARG